MTGRIALPAMQVDAAYRENRRLLVFVAVRKFDIPADEAEALLHDVFISFISCGMEVRDPRSWLVAAMCNASRAYLRRRIHETQIEEAEDLPSAADVGRMDRELHMRRTISALLPRDRELLRLRYVEGLTAAEIAGRLRLKSVGYTHKVMSKAIRRTRAAYRGELPQRRYPRIVRRALPEMPTRLQDFFAANGLVLEAVADGACVAADHLRRFAAGVDVPTAAKMLRILRAVRKTTGRFVRLSDLFEVVHWSDRVVTASA